MHNNNQHHIKRHYKKFVAAVAGALALTTAALLPGLPAPAPAPLHSETTAAPPAPESPPDQPPVAQADQNPTETETTPEEKTAAKVLDITATAYAPGPHDNEQWGNKTYIGTNVRPGVIAVDPRIIPLGSRVIIKYADGHKEYAVAEDTGGAIKGHRIDVAKWTVDEAHRFGIKPVKVYVFHNKRPQNQDRI
ncbi:MAG: hypothetical protein H6Q74_681 [Firmicutes bacterium]|nr:hypothetical protein [Bacillota bacterium]